MKKSRAAELEEKRKYWENHLRQWQESGSSQADYCREHKLNLKSFGYWKRKLRAEKSPLALVEVSQFHVAAVSSPSKSLQLEVKGIYRIEIERGFDAQTLRQLLEVLER